MRFAMLSIQSSGLSGHLRRTISSKDIFGGSVNLFRRPESTNYDDESDEDSQDLLDRHIESFKLIFIFICLVALFYLISSLLTPSFPVILNLLDDPVFLTFRMLIILIISPASAWFCWKWRSMLKDQETKLNAMNLNIQEQIIQVNSYMLLQRIEKCRGRG